MILLLKTKSFLYVTYHLPCSCKIFINVLSFLFVKGDFKETCKKMSFCSFF